MRKLLLVDDNKSTRNSIAYLLKREGYDVRSIGDPVEALEHFQQGGFDAVITDFAMPGMDGLALTRRMHSVAPDVPVLVMSGHTEVTRQMALDAGAVEFIDKPILINLLMGKLKIILEPANDEVRSNEENVQQTIIR
jgi:DNA-binding NtrC family response regulator